MLCDLNLGVFVGQGGFKYVYKGHWRVNGRKRDVAVQALFNPKDPRQQDPPEMKDIEKVCNCFIVCELSTEHGSR